MEVWANDMVKKAFKTQGTLEQLKTFGRELAMSSQGGWGSSKEFLDLVKSIGEAKSKAEEERIVAAEIEMLKRRIVEPDVPRKKMKEYIIRLVYVEMLGHDASFGYIQAVKMTHDDNLLLKRSGYLAVTLFLNEDHDLIILIVNTIQKDLKSDNYLVCCAALTAVCKLLNEETIPAVLPQVVELLAHPKELVRKKAVMALHRFHQRSPSTVSHLIPKFRQILCDKDPSVMSAALCALFDLVTADANAYRNLTISFVSILKQVVEHRLSKLFDYHRTPAPFIQIKILKILALLGAGEKHTSENMYSVLAEVLKRSDPASNIGNAILYECICTITTIHASPRLLEMAAEITSRFLKSENHNYKYMGIDALGRVIKINPDFAEQHQLAVIDCLEDPDDTLKRKTLDLLYKMTKSSNVEVIVEHMISYMRTLNDAHNKTELAGRVIELAERFAPSNQWFIQTMNQVFELAGDLVPPKVAHDLMRLLAEGAGEDDEEADSLLRSSAVESYLHVLGEPKLPSVLLQVICWVLGEYGTADGTHSADDIIGRLCDVAESHPGDITVKGYSITAITKICAFEISAGRQVDLIPECRTFIEDLLASHSTDLQQRAYELQAILALSPETVANMLPMDASCEDIEVDRNLSFLNEFVESAAANGARSYMPENERSGMNIVVTGTHEQLEPSAHALRFEAYEVPKPAAPPPIAAAPAALPFPDFEEQKPESSRSLRKQLAADREPDADSLHPEIVRLRLDGVQKKWGRYSQPQSSSTSTSSLDRRGDHGSDQVTQVGGGHREAVAASSIESGSVSELRQIERKKPQPEISTEKQRLAASLFGGPTASGRFSGSGGAKVSSRPGTVVQPAEKVLPPRPSSGGSKEKVSDAGISKQIAAPSIPAPVDLLDMSDDNVPRVMTTAPGNDPFKQLEGLLEPVTTSSALPVPPQTASMDLMSLYDGNPAPSATGPVTTLPDLVSIAAPSSSSGASQSSTNGFPSLMDLGELSANPFVELTGSVQGQASSKPMSRLKKGPSRQDSLQKDAASRHVGVTPTGTNPALFQDLFG